MRKTATIIMPPNSGRDSGKVYVLTEMPASKAEKWAARAILALSKSGIDFPEGSGMAELSSVGIKALGNMDFHDAEYLMDEMMQCVSIQTDPQKNPSFVRPLIEEDIEEVATRFKLKMEVFALHTGFSLPGAGSISALAQPGPEFTFSNTRMSQGR
jgi:hypothetical protein